MEEDMNKEIESEEESEVLEALEEEDDN